MILLARRSGLAPPDPQRHTHASALQHAPDAWSRQAPGKFLEAPPMTKVTVTHCHIDTKSLAHASQGGEPARLQGCHQQPKARDSHGIGVHIHAIQRPGRAAPARASVSRLDGTIAVEERWKAPSRIWPSAAGGVEEAHDLRRPKTAMAGSRVRSRMNSSTRSRGSGGGRSACGRPQRVPGTGRPGSGYSTSRP